MATNISSTRQTAGRIIKALGFGNSLLSPFNDSLVRDMLSTYLALDALTGDADGIERVLAAAGLETYLLTYIRNPDNSSGTERAFWLPFLRDVGFAFAEWSAANWHASSDEKVARLLDLNALALGFHFRFKMPATLSRQLAIVVIDHYAVVSERVEAKGMVVSA